MASVALNNNALPDWTPAFAGEAPRHRFGGGQSVPLPRRRPGPSR